MPLTETGIGGAAARPGAGMRVLRPPSAEGRLLARDPLATESRAEYERLVPGYPAAGRTAGELEELFEACPIGGRGGGGFPAAAKMRALDARPEGRRVVVANGAETEPTSLKDRYLMRHRPHLVLHGLLLAAVRVRATHAFVFVADDDSESALRAAWAEIEADAPVRVRFHRGSSSLVAGEETAVVSAVNGRGALPTTKPPRPFTSGVGRLPTLVQNVETLACLAVLDRLGPGAYAAVGTDGAPGTFLATVSRPGSSPALVEIPYGTSVRTLAETAGIPADDAAAVLCGGFFGGMITPDRLAARLTPEEARRHRFGIGCGAFVVVGDGDCPVAAVADAAHFLAGQTASQCGSCVNGTAAIRETTARLAAGAAGQPDLDNLARWAATLPGRGACTLPGGLARLLGALLDDLPDLVRAHVTDPCEVCASATFGYGRTRYDLGDPRP